jgi:hypothetical protein
VIPENDSNKLSTGLRPISAMNGIDPKRPKITQKMTVTRNPSWIAREFMSLFETANNKRPADKVIKKKPKKDPTVLSSNMTATAIEGTKAKLKNINSRPTRL